MLDDKTLCSYRYMSHNIPGVTALQQHTLYLFYSISTFQQKKLRNCEIIDHYSKTFV